jgi:hypothetical protein
MLGITSNPVNPYMFDTGFATNCLFFAGISKVKFDGYDEDEKYKYINLAPTAGYFIIDNLVAGLTFNIFSIKFDESYLVREGMWSIGPYVRYYYPFKKVAPFAELNVSLGGLTGVYGDSGGNENKEKAGLFNLGGGAGAAIPIGGVVTIDIMGGYFMSTLREEITNIPSKASLAAEYEKTKYNTLGFKVGIHVFLTPGD